MLAKFFRIDDRLLHGQVLEGWVNKFHIQHIILPNDEIAEDFMWQNLMKMTLPNDFDIIIDKVDNIISKFKAGKINITSDTLILVASPKDAYSLIENNIVPEYVNVGGMHYKDGKEQIFEFLSVDKSDCMYLNLINKKNISLLGKPLPDSETVDIMKNIIGLDIFPKS